MSDVSTVEHQTLSKELDERHTEKVDWGWISRCQKFSEEFIERHIDKVNWREISLDQKLKVTSFRNFKRKLWWSRVKNNKQSRCEIGIYLFRFIVQPLLRKLEDERI